MKEPSEGRKFKRGNIWWIALYVNGREQRESTGTTDEQRAIKIWSARVKELHHHEVDPTKPFLAQRDRKRTVADLLDSLKADFQIRGKDSPQNLSNIKRAREDFGMFRAMALCSDDIDSYVMERLDAGSAKASINRVLQLLKQSYRLAKIPAPDIRRLDESDNVRSGFFSESEIRRVIANLPADLADFTLFGWLVGMRKAEIASLRWEDVDGESIRLRAENAKTGTARLIPFEGELAEVMERRKAARKVKTDGAVTLAALIFHRDGEPVREFRKSWATACRKAGVKRLFHDLRRSAARNMTQAGVPQSVAMKITGHKTDSMFRRYAIASESDLRTALRDTQQHSAATKENVVAMAKFPETRTKDGQNTKSTRQRMP